MGVTCVVKRRRDDPKLEELDLEAECTQSLLTTWKLHRQGSGLLLEAIEFNIVTCVSFGRKKFVA